MAKNQYEIHILNSMQKVFPEKDSIEQWRDGEYKDNRISALKGECISFQIAMRILSEAEIARTQAGENPMPTEGDMQTPGRLIADCCASAIGEIAGWVQVRRVDLTPSVFAAHAYHDENHLRTTPGMYPDILRKKQELRCTDDFWAAFWISVWIPEDAESGEKQVQIHLTEKIPGTEYTVTEYAGTGCIRADKEMYGEEITTVTVTLDIIDAVLPKQKLIHTEWFHGDCLADYYKVPVLSEEWWRIAGNFITTAVKHGMNMILTPIFTPPLDTSVGGERTTIQLVSIEKIGTEKTGAEMSDGELTKFGMPAEYRFDFTNFERWVLMCRDAGMEFFEMAHLFTQWGAAFTPKIMIKVAGREEKLFGWHVKADSPEYAHFLQEFLPALIQKLKDLKIADRTIFHVSDEPEEANLESYQKAKVLVAPLLKGFPIYDALSHVDFYKQGIVEHPIPANDAIEPFLEEEVPGLWTYYCVAQWNKVSNRFCSMPGARTRILGAQLYRHHMAGFLHWGYNFYNTQFSREHLNPYEITDAGNAFPSGDPFLVYPGAGGKAVASVRLMLMLEAMQDLRALECLETLVGREKAEEILTKDTDILSFSEYPRDSRWIIEMRERVNRAIAEQMIKRVKEV